MRVRVVLATGFVLLANALPGQQSLRGTRIDVGVIGGAARGVDAGKGWDLTATGRWSPHRQRWFVVRTDLSVISLRNAAFTTDVRDVLPGAYAQFNDYRVNASAISLDIGPEIRAQLGRVSPYLHLGLGGMNATSSGEYLVTRTPARDTFPANEQRPGGFSPLNERKATIGVLALSPGVRTALSRGMRLDLEARRTHTGRVPWKREGFVSGNGVPLASVLYTRRLDAWSFRVGASYAR